LNFYKVQSFDFIQLQAWAASDDFKAYHRQPIFY
jgi:hypothetical protein